jgi:hypothetical protein
MGIVSQKWLSCGNGMRVTSRRLDHFSLYFSRRAKRRAVWNTSLIFFQTSHLDCPENAVTLGCWEQKTYWKASFTFPVCVIVIRKKKTTSESLRDDERDAEAHQFGHLRVRSVFNVTDGGSGPSIWSSGRGLGVVWEWSGCGLGCGLEVVWAWSGSGLGVVWDVVWRWSRCISHQSESEILDLVIAASSLSLH